MAENVTWIVIGSIFAVFFVITYFISAVKAVKDRKRLKIIRDVKRRARVVKHAYLNQGNTNSPQHNGIEVPEITIEVCECHPDRINGKRTFSSETIKKEANGREPRVIYQSNNDKMQINTPTCSVPKSQSPSPSYHQEHKKTDPSSNSKQTIAKYDGISHNSTILNPSSLSPECLHVSKILRRRSYDVAVAQFSLLQQDPPSYASCKDIVTMYEGGDKPLHYVNCAYDSEISKDVYESNRL